jgi:hypothetical protein
MSSHWSPSAYAKRCTRNRQIIRVAESLQNIGGDEMLLHNRYLTNNTTERDRFRFTGTGMLWSLGPSNGAIWAHTSCCLLQCAICL